MTIKNIFNKIKRLPKKAYIGIAATLVVLAIPAVVFASWGPQDRRIFDWDNPADRGGSLTGPVFNSFIHTPTYGDERNFTEGSPGTRADWTDDSTATPGEEVEVRVFVHNNANQATNDAAHNYLGVARNTRVKVTVPSGQANGFSVVGYVHADNATPRDVFDSTVFKNDQQAFSLSYVPGSARAYNGAHPNGIAVSDEIVTSANGAPIGFNDMNGEVPGCFEFQSVVIIKLRVNAPKLALTKQVTTPGSSDWKERMPVNKGDTVSWLISFKNTGNDVINNLTIRDVLPKGVQLVPGSIRVFDPGRPADGQPLNDNALSAGGVDLGNYGPNGGGFIRFRTVVTEEIADACMARNIAFGRGGNVPEQSDTAEVVVENCKPVTPVTPTGKLPNTGAGDVLGIFAATTIAGAVAYRLIWLKRLGA